MEELTINQVILIVGYFLCGLALVSWCLKE